mmetsp:Transcript_2764/g.3890  ORF Transcript_2764/g.3890 Transcript_2764/m.3890 type:complete len:379 (-) Transcript_2764:57-1193(-)
MNSKLLVLLEHSTSCTCDESCPLAIECKDMKLVISHFRSCEKYPCMICKDMTDLTKSHSRNCKRDMCPVSKCNTLKHSMIVDNSYSTLRHAPEKNKCLHSPTKCVASSSLVILPSKSSFHSPSASPSNCSHTSFESNNSDDRHYLETPKKSTSNRNQTFTKKPSKTKAMQEARKIAMIEKREDLIRKRMLPKKHIEYSNRAPILSTSRPDSSQVFQFELFPSPSASYNAFEDNELSSLASNSCHDNETISSQTSLKRNSSFVYQEHSYPSPPVNTSMSNWMQFNNSDYSSSINPSKKSCIMSSSLSDDLNEVLIEPLDLFQCEFNFDPNENLWMLPSNHHHNQPSTTSQEQLNAVSSCSETDDDNWLSFLDDEDAISI